MFNGELFQVKKSELSQPPVLQLLLKQWLLYYLPSTQSNLVLWWATLLNFKSLLHLTIPQPRQPAVVVLQITVKMKATIAMNQSINLMKLIKIHPSMMILSNKTTMSVIQLMNQKLETLLSRRPVDSNKLNQMIVIIPCL